MGERFGYLAAPALNQSEQGFDAAVFRGKYASLFEALIRGVELLLARLQQAQIHPPRRLTRRYLAMEAAGLKQRAEVDVATT